MQGPSGTDWHRVPYLIGYFSQKSPIIIGSLAERDLQLKASYASLPPGNPYYKAV